MSVRSQPERVTHSVQRAAQWTAAALLALLVVHVSFLRNSDPTTMFNIHLVIAGTAASAAVFAWCTRQILRSHRKNRDKFSSEIKRLESLVITRDDVQQVIKGLESRMITRDDVQQILQEAYDEGQITGLATGLADLRRGEASRRTGEV